MSWTWPVSCAAGHSPKSRHQGTRAPHIRSVSPSLDSMAQPCLCCPGCALYSCLHPLPITHPGKTPNLENLQFRLPAPAAAPGELGEKPLAHWSHVHWETLHCPADSCFIIPSVRVQPAWCVSPSSLPWGCSLTLCPCCPLTLPPALPARPPCTLVRPAHLVLCPGRPALTGPGEMHEGELWVLVAKGSGNRNARKLWVWCGQGWAAAGSGVRAAWPGAVAGFVLWPLGSSQAFPAHGTHNGQTGVGFYLRPSESDSHSHEPLWMLTARPPQPTEARVSDEESDTFKEGQAWLLGGKSPVPVSCLSTTGGRRATCPAEGVASFS